MRPTIVRRKASAPTTLQQRNSWVHDLVSREVHSFLDAFVNDMVPERECLTCGRPFQPVQRYHFFCEKDCRVEFYRGQIRPRVER